MKTRAFKQSLWTFLAIVVLLLVATSPFSTVLLVKWHASRIVNDTMAGLSSSGTAHSNIAEGFVETAILIASTNAVERQQLFAEVTKLSQSTDLNLREYEKSITAPAERAAYDELIRHRQEFRRTRQRVVELLNENRRDDAVKLYYQEALPQFRTYMQSMDRIITSGANEARLRGNQILRLCNIMMVLQGILLLFFFVYAFFVPLAAVLEKLSQKESVKDL